MPMAPPGGEWQEQSFGLAFPPSFAPQLQASEYLEFVLSRAAGGMPAAALRCCGTGESCDWYHGAWPVLRVLNLVASPDWHGEFYVRATGDYAAAHPGELRVLVSGTADATIIDHLRLGLGPFDSARVRVDVIDICETPLALVRDYVCEYDPGFEVETIKADARRLVDGGVSAGCYDLIVADAFLTRFSEPDKFKVLDQWARVLKGGGQVITACRIGGNQKMQAMPEDVAEFGDRAVQAYLQFGMLDSRVEAMADLCEVRQLAEAYAARMFSVPAGAETIISLFRSSGFEFRGAGQTFERDWTSGEHRPTEYARIVAQKP